MRLIALLALAGCEPAHRDEPVPPPVPVPIPPPVIDARLACRADGDCEVFTSCCAHCNPPGRVISVNHAHRVIGELVTLSFYCPMCAEAGCTAIAPRREPICKAGRCARRETTFTDYDRTQVASIALLDTDPVILEAGDKAALGMTVSHQACTRLATCGIQAPLCGMLGREMPAPYLARTRSCLDAVAALPCGEVAAVLDGKAPGACRAFLRP